MVRPSLRGHSFRPLQGASRPRARPPELGEALTKAKPRGVTDRLLDGFIQHAPPLFSLRLSRWVLPCLSAGLVCQAWPFMGLRSRALRAGHRLAPWAWGREMGLSLCDLLGTPRVLEVTGELPAPNSGLLLLSAHLGPWEAGAAELARRGYRPMVLASPWERLPRAAQSLAERREQQGIATAFRGRAGWRMATGHLRAGGTVVALVDSLSPRRPGRRALNFVAGPVGAPDALLAWAERQGAEVRVALGRPGGFVIETLEAHAGVGPGMSRSATSDSLRRRSDQCVERLQQAVEANPSSWAWVRALALLVFALPSLSLSSCSAAELVPPLPRDPADWITEAEGLRWTGEVDAGLRGRLHAAKAVGEWKDGKPHGLGTATFANGDKYIGEFKDGKANGQGIFTFTNGNKYAGEFKDGKYHGQGTFINADGRKYVGEFKENQPWTGFLYDSDGNVLSEYKDGVEIKQE